MKVKIRIEQLKPGMHIVSTNRGWLQLPFFRRHVQSQAVIEKLVLAGVTDLVIDTSKGEAPDQETEQREMVRTVGDDPLLIKAAMTEAEDVQAQCVAQTKKMMEDVRDGKGFDSQAAELQVRGLMNQLMTDPKSMLVVSVLRSSDKTIFDHCVNLTVLALYMADSLGFSQEKALLLGQGALLHDLGKCMLPRDLVHKVGTLNDEEKALMRTHVEKGSAYLARTGTLSPEVRDFIEQHHEQPDGRGYPRKLSAGRMSEFGCLAAVLNRYDNLLHRPILGEPVSPREVLDHMAGEVNARIEKSAYEKLLLALGPYPPGTLVMLDSGEIAIAMEPNAQTPERPKTLLMTRMDGSFLETAQPFDLLERTASGDFAKSIVTEMNQNDTNFNPIDILADFSKQEHS